MATQGIILDVTLCFFNGVFCKTPPQLCWGPTPKIASRRTKKRLSGWKLIKSKLLARPMPQGRQ